MEHIVGKVEKQEIEIQYIKQSLNELVEQNKQQNYQLSKISESIQKQEIILEKISNLEEKYQESTKRVHKRIDEEIRHFEDRISKVEKQCVECCNRPCVNHNAVDNEIKHINEKINKHGSYFWFVNSAVIGAVIMALVGLILKKWYNY